MKPLRYTLIALAASCGFAYSQTTAYTTPVGYVTLPTALAESDTYISIPLDRSVEFAGTIASVAGNVITLSGTPGLGDLTTVPHTAKITSGTGAGIVALITANTADTLTIAVPAGDSLTGVVATDKIEINKGWTVSSLLGTPAAQTQLLGFTGGFSGFGAPPDIIFEFDGANWIDTDSFESADNAVLFPNETWIIRTVAGGAIPGIVMTGTVPVADSRVVLSSVTGGKDNANTFFGAVGEVIGTSGLTAIAEPGDQVLGFNNNAVQLGKPPSTIIEYDGTAWIDTDSFDDVTNTFKLEAGVGYIIRLVGTTPGDKMWKNQPDYVPSL